MFRYFITGIWQLKTKLYDVISTLLFLGSMVKSIKLFLFQIHSLYTFKDIDTCAQTNTHIPVQSRLLANKT